MKIKEKIVRKFNRKTGEYDKEFSVFAKYSIGRVSVSERTGWRAVEVIGPKQQFCLCECAKPLKIITPPTKDGENAGVRELPLFFVTSAVKVTKIQGCTHFALDGEVLIPYRSSGCGLVEEL
jgi:hypothetical protein